MTRHRARLTLWCVVGLSLIWSRVDAQTLKLEWGSEGYYRTRAVQLTNLAHEPRREVAGGDVVLPDITNTSYITQRLRLSPFVKFGTIARLNMQLDAFDDVLFGDNNAINSAPLFSVNGSNQYFLGGKESASVNMTRAWIEFQIPVGLMRVGRMPSHWGMGLLANGGGSGNWDPLTPIDKPKRHVADYYFDDDFGDNHFGSTNDRILFATRPMTIIKTIQKKADTSSNFLIAYAFDKLSEAPMLGAEPDRVNRPFGEQGFISRGSQQDDVNEHVFVAAYSNPDWDQVRITDELKFGTYWVIRTQDEAFTEPSRGPPHTRNAAGQCVQIDDPTNTVPDEQCVTKDEGSFVWIADLWYRIRYGFWYSEAEAIHIGGESTGGVPFPSPNKRKKANIDGAVWRGGYLTPMWDALLEVGYSSGDNDVADSTLGGDFTLKQRALHPDFNVGLILFEEVIRERMARTFGPPFFSDVNPDGAKGLFSNGGVINSKYVQIKGKWRPDFGGFEIVGGLLLAWLDEWADTLPGVFPCPFDKLDAEGKCTASKYLGTELDVAVKSRFADDHLDFSLEGGYLHFGDALKVQSGTGQLISDHATGSYTIQARIAYIF